MCKYKKCFFFVPNFSLNFYDQIINTLHKQLFMYILIIWHIHNIITTKQEFDQKYVNYWFNFGVNGDLSRENDRLEISIV